MAGTVERAFQLAPACRSMPEVRAKLVREGFTQVDMHLQGSLLRELRKLLRTTARNDLSGDRI